MPTSVTTTTKIGNVTLASSEELTDVARTALNYLMVNDSITSC